MFSSVVWFVSETVGELPMSVFVQCMPCHTINTHIRPNACTNTHAHTGTYTQTHIQTHTRKRTSTLIQLYTT